MALTIITTHRRPENTQNLFANASRQDGARLIVIENGAAIGSCKAHGFTPDVLLTSEPHQSYARTAGLKWMRAHKGGWFCMMDADDYYGAGYVTRMHSYADCADVVGFSGHLVHRETGHLVHYARPLGATESVTGPTVSGFAEVVPDYVRPDGEDWNDDGRFCQDLRAQGGTIWAIAPRHHFYRRHDDNVWQLSDEKLNALFRLRCETGTDYGPVTDDEAAAIADDFDTYNSAHLTRLSFETQRAVPVGVK